jgi:16S rRNA (adenine1518-N6/adenine1519-N6)-dimethyltransferase
MASKIPIPRKEAMAAGFWTKKGLGQHLLRDASVVSDILAALAPAPEEAIVEIGPGLGALTEALLQTGCPVLAVEVDERACQVLRGRFQGAGNFHLVQADVLDTDLAALVREKLGEKSFHIAANLPYYITTPILARILEGGVPFTRMVVLAQREVALRLAAVPGGKAYGALSLMAQYRAEVVFLRKVLPGAFTPPPKVDSGLVLFRRLQRPAARVKDEAYLFKVIRTAFGKRRKTLRNALLMGELELEPGRLDKAFESAGIDPGRRAETLGLNEFAKLADAIL